MLQMEKEGEVLRGRKEGSLGMKLWARKDGVGLGLGVCKGRASIENEALPAEVVPMTSTHARGCCFFLGRGELPLTVKTPTITIHRPIILYSGLRDIMDSRELPVDTYILGLFLATSPRSTHEQSPGGGQLCTSSQGRGWSWFGAFRPSSVGRNREAWRVACLLTCSPGQQAIREYTHSLIMT